MQIDREAWKAAGVAALPAALAGATGRRTAALTLLALPVGVIAFFRDPDRPADTGTAIDDDIVLSPADGKVMHAGPGQDGVAPEGEWLQVSIFLSLFDVHMNRAPYGGTVKSVTYRPGKWLAAYKFESAFENERSDIVMSRTVGGESRDYVFRQIVGLVARRVVTRVRAGDEIQTGERIGLMKFGSRMDVFLPTTVDLKVSEGDRVVAGETVIAQWPAAAPAKKAATKKSPAKRTPAKNPPRPKGAGGTPTPAKKSPARKAPAKKTPTKRTPARKSARP